MIGNDTIQKLGCAFLFTATVAISITICEMLNVKEWRDLENCVRGCSRSLKMVPFDRPYRTVYCPAMVSIALSYTIFELPVFGIE